MPLPAEPEGGLGLKPERLGRFLGLDPVDPGHVLHDRQLQRRRSECPVRGLVLAGRNLRLPEQGDGEDCDGEATCNHRSVRRRRLHRIEEERWCMSRDGSCTSGQASRRDAPDLAATIAHRDLVLVIRARAYCQRGAPSIRRASISRNRLRVGRPGRRRTGPRPSGLPRSFHSDRPAGPAAACRVRPALSIGLAGGEALVASSRI